MYLFISFRIDGKLIEVPPKPLQHETEQILIAKIL